VFDDAIAENWKKEMMATEGRDVTQKMADWIIAELRYKAQVFKDTGTISVYDGDVVKSDIAVSPSIKAELQAAVRVLENIPDVYKDYHPGSDGKILDLVHPSLFPLIYGRSRILPDFLATLDDCVECCGKGVVIRGLDDKDVEVSWEDGQASASSYSKNFQVGTLPAHIGSQAWVDFGPKSLGFPQVFWALYLQHDTLQLEHSAQSAPSSRRNRATGI
jgi:hypothetical protein